MAKKRTERPDSERRVRQCARFARQLRILRLVMGHGRWDAEAIAHELECSVRTVFRDIQVLVLADVPVYFDEEHQSYKVRPGYRFPGITSHRTEAYGTVNLPSLVSETHKAIGVLERYLEQLRELSARLRSESSLPTDTHRQG
jgi:predicted DNA-binding transcriptional regulator YafY